MLRVDELEAEADQRRRAKGASSALATAAAYAELIEALRLSAEVVALAAERTGPH